MRVAQCEECFGRRLVAKLVNEPPPSPDRLTPVLSNYGDLGELTVETYVARMSGAALVLGTLLAGFVWMIGAAAVLGIKINFLNFVALPVTLGIGVDYGVNIYLRSKLEGPGRLLQAVRATGGAVALCSATTIIGYGALLVADNRALRSFGTLAILGEIACLSAALVLMPALLAMGESKTSPDLSSEPP